VRTEHHYVYYIIFGVFSQVQVPFRHVARLPENRRNYNRRLSSARVVVERAFGLLKAKWRRLFFLTAYNRMYAVQSIQACVVLHNFIVLDGDVEVVSYHFRVFNSFRAIPSLFSFFFILFARVELQSCLCSDESSHKLIVYVFTGRI